MAGWCLDDRRRRRIALRGVRVHFSYIACVLIIDANVRISNERMLRFICGIYSHVPY
jgi:hypothetical protein